jgi:threonine/homoserine/homoserine lactone efflux protein
MTPVQAALAFAIAAGILTITPGLDTALVLRTAAASGPRAAAKTALGILLGLFVWGVVTAVGIGALLRASTLAYRVLQVAGSLYLLWLGLNLLLRRGSKHGTETVALAGGGRLFARGLLTNLLNPKVGVFYATFLPQFIPAGANVTWTSIAYAGLHALEGVVWFAALILATRPLAAWLRRERVQRNLDRATGAVFLVAGARLALDRGR